MTIVIFCGPTISASDVTRHLDAVCMAPVAQGDIYRALELEPRAIGIIDGYFQGVPAVWHKEILWALSQGVQVFGSASMGALRAAELHQMGMIGVGRIFEDYVSGELEDDDEVAVLHGPAEMGFKLLGEPMVNVRATVQRAMHEGIIGAAAGDEITKCAKAMFYKQRTWKRVLDQLAANGVQLEGFKDWLGDGYVDQKRRDAEAMLVAIKVHAEGGFTAPEAGFEFEHTLAWQRGMSDWQSGPDNAQRLVLEEIRLQPERYEQIREQAQFRVLALDESERSEIAVDAGDCRAALNALRERHGLLTQAALNDWMAGNALTQPVLDDLIADEVRLAAVTLQISGDADREMLALLRLGGEYEALQRRARHKAKVLSEAGFDAPSAGNTGLYPIQLAAWYFRECIAKDMPHDLAAYARALGFAGLEPFYDCLAREYLYLTLRENREF